LPEAIGLLRKVRQRAHDGALVCVSGADPLNLVGTLIPGTRVPAITGSRILYRDGMPIATMIANEITLLETMSPTDTARARSALLRHGAPSLAGETTRSDIGPGLAAH